MLERKREIVAQVERERIEKQKANAANQHQEPSVKKLTEPKDDNSSRAQAKAAEIFNTNRTYVNKAAGAPKGNVNASKQLDQNDPVVPAAEIAAIIGRRSKENGTT